MISGYKGSTINAGWLNKLPFYSVFTVSKSIVSKISKHDRNKPHRFNLSGLNLS